jgi:predicted HTH domain antitoxin
VKFVALEEAMPKSLTLTIPESLARKWDCMGEDLLIDLLERGLREFKIEQALDRYGRGGISFGAAARQACVSRSELGRQAYARGMDPPFSAETLDEEQG